MFAHTHTHHSVLGVFQLDRNGNTNEASFLFALRESILLCAHTGSKKISHCHSRALYSADNHVPPRKQFNFKPGVNQTHELV